MLELSPSFPHFLLYLPYSSPVPATTMQPPSAVALIPQASSCINFGLNPLGFPAFNSQILFPLLSSLIVYVSQFSVPDFVCPVKNISPLLLMSIPKQWSPSFPPKVLFQITVPVVSIFIKA